MMQHGLIVHKCIEGSSIVKEDVQRAVQVYSMYYPEDDETLRQIVAFTTHKCIKQCKLYKEVDTSKVNITLYKVAHNYFIHYNLQRCKSCQLIAPFDLL